MPISIVNENELPAIERTSKLDQTKDIMELQATLKTPLAPGKAIRFSLSQEILDLYPGKGDQPKKKALAGLRQKLKVAYPQYQIRVIQGEILILNNKSKKAAKA